MKISTEIKPVKYSAFGSKSNIVSKITQNKIRTFSSEFGDGYISNIINPDYVTVFNLEKHRRKSTKHAFKGTNVKVTTVHSHWDAYVYSIPISLLKAIDVKVTQGIRTFKFVKNK